MAACVIAGDIVGDGDSNTTPSAWPACGAGPRDAGCTPCERDTRVLGSGLSGFMSRQHMFGSFSPGNLMQHTVRQPADVLVRQARPLRAVRAAHTPSVSRRNKFACV